MAATFVVILIVTLLGWDYVRELWARNIIPEIRRILGDGVADRVADLISWIDLPASAVRKVGRRAIKEFQCHVLGIKTKFRWSSANQVEETTTSYIQNDPSQDVECTTTVRTISPDDLPPEIRKEMIKNGTRHGEVDVKQTLLTQVNQNLDLSS